MKKSIYRMRAQGFSLIEIIVVITIIGLIVGWAAQRIFGQGDLAQARIAKSKITSLGGALDLYKLDTGKYPSTSDGLNWLTTAVKRLLTVTWVKAVSGLATLPPM